MQTLLKSWKPKITSRLTYLKSESHKINTRYIGRHTKPKKNRYDLLCFSIDQFSSILFKTNGKGFFSTCHRLQNSHVLKIPGTGCLEVVNNSIRIKDQPYNRYKEDWLFHHQRAMIHLPLAHHHPVAVLQVQFLKTQMTLINPTNQTKFKELKLNLLIHLCHLTNQKNKMNLSSNHQQRFNPKSW